MEFHERSLEKTATVNYPKMYNMNQFEIKLIFSIYLWPLDSKVAWPLSNKWFSVQVFEIWKSSINFKRIWKKLLTSSTRTRPEYILLIYLLCDLYHLLVTLTRTWASGKYWNWVLKVHMLYEKGNLEAGWKLSHSCVVVE